MRFDFSGKVDFFEKLYRGCATVFSSERMSAADGGHDYGPKLEQNL